MLISQKQFWPVAFPPNLEDMHIGLGGNQFGFENIAVRMTYLL